VTVIGALAGAFASPATRPRQSAWCALAFHRAGPAAALVILALFQILLDINLYNTLTGLILVYVATHIAMTVYILEDSLRRSAGLVRCARMDGYSDFRDLLAGDDAHRRAAIFTTVTLNFHRAVERVLFAVVLLTDDDKRTLRLA